MQRLTDEQRDLAGLPENVALAKWIGLKYARRCPGEADDIRAAALVGLCDAASRFDPARGLRFSTYAAQRIRGAILDHMREATSGGMGCPRGMMRRNDKPEVKSLAAIATFSDNGSPLTFAEIIPAGELPVGWEIESEDTVTVYAARFPPKYAVALRAYYLRADVPTMRAASAELGLSEGRVSQMLTQAANTLREEIASGI